MTVLNVEQGTEMEALYSFDHEACSNDNPVLVVNGEPLETGDVSGLRVITATESEYRLTDKYNFKFAT